MIVREFLGVLGLDVDATAWGQGDKAVAALSSGLGKMVYIAQQVIQKIVEVTTETIDYTSKIHDTAQSVGLGTTALQELAYAGQLSSVSFDDLSHGLIILTRQMNHAKAGGEEAAKGFHKAGIKITDSTGKLRSTDDLMGEIADKFHSMPDGAEKTALAIELFGRSGARMIPLLEDGSVGLSKMRKEAHELGMVIDEELINAGEELGDNMERLKVVSQGIWRQAIAPALPLLNRIILRLIAWRKETLALVRTRVEGIVKAFGFISDAADVIVSNLRAISSALPVLLRGLKIFAFAAALVLAPLLLPFVALGAFLAGIMLIVDDIQRYKEGRDSLFGDWKKTIDEWLMPNANDPWLLRVLKDIIRFLEEALGLTKDLTSEMPADGPEPMYLRAIKTFVSVIKEAISLAEKFAEKMGSVPAFLFPHVKGGSDEAGAAAVRKRLGLPEPGALSAPNASYDPMMSSPSLVPPGAGAQSFAPTQINHISVVTQQGQSNEAIASMVEEKIQSSWDRNLSDANAHSQSGEH